MHYSRRLFLALAAGCGLSTLTLRSAHAQTPRPAARDAPDLKSLIAKATRLSVLSDRITRSQVQRSLGVLASRADRVLADSTQEARKLLTELAASNTAAATRSQIASASQAYDGLLKASEKLAITDRPALAQFARLADDVGEAVDKVVELLIKDSAQPMAGILSTTADLQRLTQHLGVHFLLARAGVEEKEQLKEVAQGREEFIKHMAELKKANLKTAQTDGLLQLLDNQWMFMNQALGSTGRDVTAMEHVCTTSERTLEVLTSLYPQYESALR